ncbi:lipoyl(octanoyl) transferase LipB [bacterium]|nr:lipoyl(octanoyl) transferase LipB [bacterium]
MPELNRDPVKQALKPVSFIRHERCGRISFDDALVLQEEAIETYRESGAGLPVIFSLEHDPVITCGRSTNSENLLLTPGEYNERGIDLRNIDRGGDATFHGPGQVVVYPILALKESGLRAGEYIRLLEDTMIVTCAEYGVQAYTRDRYRGCWTDHGKIGAVGAAVKSGGITKHGLAFNVDVDLDFFKLIVPCGIGDSPVTRLVDLAGVEFCEVEDSIVKNISRLLGLEILS